MFYMFCQKLLEKNKLKRSDLKCNLVKIMAMHFRSIMYHLSLSDFVFN